MDGRNAVSLGFGIWAFLISVLAEAGLFLLSDTHKRFRLMEMIFENWSGRPKGTIEYSLITG